MFRLQGILPNIVKESNDLWHQRASFKTRNMLLSVAESGLWQQSPQTTGKCTRVRPASRQQNERKRPRKVA